MQVELVLGNYDSHFANQRPIAGETVRSFSNIDSGP